MDRVLVIVLVLTHSAPSQSRRLSAGNLADSDHTEYPPEHIAEHHTHHESTTATADTELLSSELETADSHIATGEHEPNERYGFLSTPNYASPILNALTSPTTFPSDGLRPIPDLFLPVNNLSPLHSIPSHQDYQDYEWPVITPSHQDYQDYDWPGHKHRRKIKINDDGTLWTKFPNMKHLVEIVPIKHKPHKKGKALAYIVPKLHSIKKKLRKQKRFQGIVIDRQMSEEDLSEVRSNSEENPITDDSESKSSDSESDSIESNSSDLEDEASGDDSTEDAKIESAPERAVPHGYGSTHKDKINDKINDIVSYFKGYKDNNQDGMIHNVLPEDEDNPAYHVHYIIHKKRNPLHNHSASESHTHHPESNIIHANLKSKENDVAHKQIHAYPHFANHDIINIDNYHEDHKDNQRKEHLHQNSAHHSDHSNEHDIEPHHNHKTIHTHHPNHDLSHDVRLLAQESDTVPPHSHSSEQSGNIPLDDKQIIPIESLEKLHDFIHDGKTEPELDQLYKILAEIEKDPDHKILNNHDKPSTHHVHVYTDSTEDHSDQSNESDNQSDEVTAENNSDSVSDEPISDESYSAPDYSDSKSDEEDSIDSSLSPPSSDYVQNAFENILFHVDTLESDQNESQEPISSEMILPEQFIHEHGISALSKESTSSESTEREGLQHGDSNDVKATHLPGHDSIFPNSLKSKKKKFKKSDNGCEGHKSYSLTFLFNR